MNKLTLVKAAGEIIISAGVTNIVSNAIVATTPTNISKVKKICITVGGVIMGSMISDKVVDYTEEFVSGLVTEVKSIGKSIKDFRNKEVI